MKRVLLLGLAALILSGVGNLTAQELSGRDIMIKVDDRPDGDDRQASMEMVLINKNGKERIRSIKSFSKDYGKDKKSVMVFLKPADVKGTGFLSWEYDEQDKDDDRWLYMPALKKARRISGKSKNDYFMGSDFTYDDMGDRNIDEDTHELLREEEVNGQKCWVVKSTPVEKDQDYDYRTCWVRQDIFMAVQVEYYNDMGLMKKLLVEDIENIDGFWTAGKFVMENFENKHKTILTNSGTVYNQGLDDNIFTVSAIQRGRIR